MPNAGVSISEKGNITVTFQPDGRSKRFSGYEGIEAWAKEEEQLWARLLEAAKKVRYGGISIANIQVQFFQTLAAHAAGARNSSNPATQKQSIDQVDNHLAAIAAGQRPISASVAGKRILAALEEDPLLALGLLAWALRELNVPSNQDTNLLAFVKMMIDARLDQRLGIDDVSAQQAALDEMRTHWDERFSQQERDHQDSTELFEDSREQARRVAGTALRLINNVRRTFRESLANTQEAYTNPTCR